MDETQTVRGPDANYCPGPYGEEGHHMVSHSAGKLVKWVERCSFCGWINAEALDGWAENAIKVAGTERAKRIAVATGTEPFSFVQSSGEDLTLIEIMGQALGAASVCWVAYPGAMAEMEFDSRRAQAIGNALWQEFNRELRAARADAVTVAAQAIRDAMAQHFNAGTIEDLAQTVLATARIEAKTDPRSANAVANPDPGSGDRRES